METNNSDEKSTEIASASDHLLNREISWLAFNQRVLEEACNPLNPLLERVRFLSIAANNQEEFFMVRVAGLKSQVREHGTHHSSDGLTPQQQLELVIHKAVEFANDLLAAWAEIKEDLKRENIYFCKPGDFSEEERAWAKDYFMNEVFPMITPIAVDSSHPFPFISNKSIALALLLKNHDTEDELKAFIVLPASHKRFISLPGSSDRFISMEDFILMHIHHIFASPLSLVDYAVFNILRDAEMDIDDENGNLIETFEIALNRRKHGDVIRLTVNQSANETLIEFLKSNLHLQHNDVLVFGDTIGLADLKDLTSLSRPELLYKPFEPRFPERVLDFNGDCFAAIRAKDIVVHHPYETFDVFIKFIRQAARDPDVVSIKQTIYRTNRKSKIIEALIEAAENGKSVTALVEIKARFDEEANLRWAMNMEKAGIQVVFGFLKLKTHAKVSLITRREGAQMGQYVHFGTGNYNSETAKVYSDLSLFTCDPDLCMDAGLLFNYMTGYAQPTDLKRLTLAPFNLKETLISLIEAETENAKRGLPANMWLKCNAIADPDLIEALYRASQAGVKISMVVRGICKLRPQVPGLSDNITVKSIVGRFLEHARIYCFGAGHALPSPEAKVFISSADLMPRNLRYRIETLVPILNETVHKQILNEIMVANLKDEAQSWVMNSDGTYSRQAHDKNSFSAHNYFMEHPSLSGRGKALREKREQ